MLNGWLLFSICRIRDMLWQRSLINLADNIVLMLAAIHFNNQIVFMADEINDVMAYWFLPFEFHLHEAMRSQVIP